MDNYKEKDLKMDVDRRSTNDREQIEFNPSPKSKYHTKWQCKKCNKVFDFKNAKRAYRDYAGVKLFDFVCPKCSSKNLYSMNKN